MTHQVVGHPLQELVAQLDLRFLAQLVLVLEQFHGLLQGVAAKTLDDVPDALAGPIVAGEVEHVLLGVLGDGDGLPALVR